MFNYRSKKLYLSLPHPFIFIKKLLFILPLFSLIFYAVPIAHANSSSIGTLFQATNITFSSDHHLEFDSSVDLSAAFQMHICVINTECGTTPNYYWNAYNPTCSANHCSADFTGPYVSEAGVTSVFITVYPCDSCSLDPWPYESQPLSYPFPPPKPALQSVSVSVTPTTPMWKLDAHVTLDPSQIVCPAALTVTVGQMATTTSNICADGITPSQTDVFVPVFDNQHPANNLGPDSSAPVTAQLINADASSSSANNTAHIPSGPVWMGMGDSFSSGHHQDKNSTFLCPLEIAACGVYPNDPAFSWVTKATARLNLNVPTEWQITPSLQAASGSSTNVILTKQVPNMMTLLQSHSGSWNVVSLTGGANDTNWASETAQFYVKNSIFHTGDVPWNVQQNGKNGAGCLNTQAIWVNLDQTAMTIQANLQNIINKATVADPNVRIVDVNYPYIMKTTDRCSQDVVVNQKITWHGSKSVIDRLDALQSGSYASNGNLTLVDLRASADFGLNPLGDLQLFYIYGYPHPNSLGQSNIAALAVNQVVALHQ